MKTDMQRFLGKTTKTETCWIWNGAVKSQEHPYGLISISGKNKKAHRYSYEVHNGPIPDGAHVLHRCDNPRCVNPEHLFLGTHTDNMQDKESKGRGGKIRGEAWHKAHGDLDYLRGDNNYQRRNPELVRRGEKNPMAKLTTDQVAAVRAEYEASDKRRGTQKKLAEKYAVSVSLISLIILGRHRK